MAHVVEPRKSGKTCAVEAFGSNLHELGKAGPRAHVRRDVGDDLHHRGVRIEHFLWDLSHKAVATRIRCVPGQLGPNVDNDKITLRAAARRWRSPDWRARRTS